jgi:hypothetical protein
MNKNTTSGYYVKRCKSGARIYFRARWLKSRKTYRLYHVYPRCEDVHWRPAKWIDPVELVNESRRLKSRPTNQTLTQAWLIKS